MSDDSETIPADQVEDYRKARKILAEAVSVPEDKVWALIVDKELSIKFLLGHQPTIRLVFENKEEFNRQAGIVQTN